MIKIVLLFASALSIFIASIFVTPESSIFVEQSFPTEVKPGTEFTVTLTVHKGKQTGFARLQQFLPKGFTAEAIDTKKAQFINDEESAKFIWISLPADEVFSVSYKVKVSDNIDGKQVVNGLFYYIQDEKTQKLALDPIEITVSNSAIEAQYRVELTIHPNQKQAVLSLLMIFRSILMHLLLKHLVRLSLLKDRKQCFPGQPFQLNRRLPFLIWYIHLHPKLLRR